MADLQALKQAVIEGDHESSVKLTKQAVEEGTDPLVIFRQALVPGMDIVGRKMQDEEYYIPEVLLAVKAMKGAAEIVRPLLVNHLRKISLYGPMRRLLKTVQASSSKPAAV